MKLDIEKHRVFKEYRNKILDIREHYDECPWASRNVPMDECMCNCYEEQIFNMGRTCGEVNDETQ